MIAVLTAALRHARRLIIAVVGFTIVCLGVVMIVTPGPGWLTILLGLSILSVEFVWARRMLRSIKEGARKISQTVLPTPNPQAPNSDP